MKIKILTGIIFLAVFVSCEQNENSKVDPNTTRTEYNDGKGQIGVAGGTIYVSDDSENIRGASISIPPGALSDVENISINAYDLNDKVYKDAVAVNLTPDGLTFKTPIQITIPYKEGDVNNKAIYYYDGAERFIEKLTNINRNAVDKTITGHSDHFSAFFVADAQVNCDLELVNNNGSIGVLFRVFSNEVGDFYSIPIDLASGELEYQNDSTIQDVLEKILNNDKSASSTARFELFNEADNLLTTLDISSGLNNGNQELIYKLGNECFLPASNVTDWTNIDEIKPFFDGEALAINLNYKPEESEKLYVKLTWTFNDHFTLSDDDLEYGGITHTYVFSNREAPKSIRQLKMYLNDKNGNFIDDVFEKVISAPIVKTLEVTDITTISASTGGIINENGGAVISKMGVVWDTQNLPTLDENMGLTNDYDADNSGTYKSSITGLSPSTNYYVRAYATNEAGFTGYGNVLSFITETENFPPVAGFAASQTSVTEGDTIFFTDQSKNEPESWNWDFGDGAISSSQNPYHIYTSSGTYTVSLTVTNNFGTNTMTKTNYITVSKNNSGNETGTVTDIDGNQYRTVKIGAQWWMAENLKVTNYPDGTAIINVTDKTEWIDLADNDTTGAYCFYNNDSVAGYSALYTYGAAKKACPEGWHLPSESEWNEMINFLIDNGYNYDGSTFSDKTGKALAATTGWEDDINYGYVGNDQSSNNTSGFTALPKGNRSGEYGSFNNLGSFGYWWCNTEKDSRNAYYRYLGSHFVNVRKDYVEMSYGFSVRCIKDD